MLLQAIGAPRLRAFLMTASVGWSPSLLQGAAVGRGLGRFTGDGVGTSSDVSVQERQGVMFLNTLWLSNLLRSKLCIPQRTNKLTQVSV